MKTKRGLTFIEIVISICILALVIFTTYEALISGYRFYSTTKSSTNLMKLAQGQLETIASNRNPSNEPWTYFSDRKYQYKVEQVYQASYNIYDITLTSRGPLDNKGSVSSLTKTIELKTTIVPNTVGKTQDDSESGGSGSYYVKKEI